MKNHRIHQMIIHGHANTIVYQFLNIKYYFGPSQLDFITKFQIFKFNYLTLFSINLKINVDF